MNRILIFFAIAVAALFLATPSAEAQVRASCAQVRCAAGSCIDTPQGPVCQPNLSCANVLCAEGYQCNETASGPQCEPASTPWTPWPSEPQACPMVYDPVCAQKQVQCVRAPCPPVTRTFGNACEAGLEDFTVLYNGQCRSKPVPPTRPRYCPRNYDPVCAERGGERRTFSNSCEASQNQFFILAHGRCWTGPQPEPRPQYCPANYDPVCGRKGRELRTKSNRCVAIRDHFEILYNGECR